MMFFGWYGSYRHHIPFLSSARIFSICHSKWICYIKASNKKLLRMQAIFWSDGLWLFDEHSAYCQLFILVLFLLIALLLEWLNLDLFLIQFIRFLHTNLFAIYIFICVCGVLVWKMRSVRHACVLYSTYNVKIYSYPHSLFPYEKITYKIKWAASF